MRKIALTLGCLAVSHGARVHSISRQSERKHFTDDEIIQTVSNLQRSGRPGILADATAVDVFSTFLLALNPSVAHGSPASVGSRRGSRAALSSVKKPSGSASSSSQGSDSNGEGKRKAWLSQVVKRKKTIAITLMLMYPGVTANLIKQALSVPVAVAGVIKGMVFGADESEDEEPVAATETKRALPRFGAPKEESRSKLKPFARGRPTTIQVDAALEKKLSEGGAWTSVQTQGRAGLGRAVLDINAPQKIVWEQLLDFSSYPKKVSMVSQCRPYSKEKTFTTERIKVRFVSPVLPGYKFTYYCDHTYEPSKNSLTWTLDFDQKNDIEDVQGHWHVEPVPNDESRTRLFYEVNTVTPSFIPKFVIKHLTKKAINDATSWVKKASESAAR